MKAPAFTLAALWLALALTPAHAESPVPPYVLPDPAATLLEDRCLSCHDADTHKGDVRLDNLAELDLAKRLDLLNHVQEQLWFRKMPPKDKKQPSEAERDAALAALARELKAHHASTLEHLVQKPENANTLDHDKLFSGAYKDLPGFTPDRRWLISEFIFTAKFQDMLEQKTNGKHGGKQVPVLGGNRINGLSLTNPFLLPNTSGVRYYANEDLTAGHLSSMLTNAQKTSEFITDNLAKRKGSKFLPGIAAIMALEDTQELTLAARRAFLDTRLAGLCEDLYGAENTALLPAFKPVELKPPEPLAPGETYKKAPIHVAQNMLKDLGAELMVYSMLLDPEKQKLSDDAFRALCERTWFYAGDHERTIQGRMALLRDYLPEFRESLASGKMKFTPPVVKPLPDSEMAVLRDTVKSVRRAGDRYGDIRAKCLSAWEEAFARERAAHAMPSDTLLEELVRQLSVQILQRPPTAEESREYATVARSYVSKLGKRKAIQKLIQTFILSTEFVYRQEFGAGEPDAHGRRLLPPREASTAIAYALTDQSPDPELARAAAEGRLNSREDYRREVERILKNRERFTVIDTVLLDKNFAENTTRLPIRELRFFREFFGYPAAISIFKDEKRFGGDRVDDATCRLINEADRLVEHILERDRDVFAELLTTDSFYLYHDGDNARMQAASDRIKRIYAHFKDLDWKNFKKEDLLAHADFLREVKMRNIDPDRPDAGTRQGSPLQLFKLSMTSITARLDKGQREASPFDLFRGYGYDFMPAYNVAMFWGIPLDNWPYATQQPAPVPNRRGLLTHPAWLVAFAKNTETDPIHRGRWVREKLLAGTVPATPITVDAVIPENHNQTLRQRLASATEQAYCWKCHETMNPLGYAFEHYDDFGRFRSMESLEYPDQLVKKQPDEAGLLIDTRDLYKTLPVNATGRLDGTGDPALDGDVRDALDLVGRLAKSTRVRQSIIRHAFRYFLGRNETLSDSKTLIDADQAYLASGGSFDAVIVSLLTSDSFIYRKPIED